MSNAQYLASLVNSSGNIVVPVANGGIVFNNTNTTASPTSTTQNDYETGTWTPTDQSGASLSFTTNYAYYTKIGNMVYCSCAVTYPSTASGAQALISVPFSVNSSAQSYGGFTRYTTYSSNIEFLINVTPASVAPYLLSTGLTNANLSGKRLDFVAVYQASF